MLIYGALMSIHISVGLVPVKKHKSDDPLGQNILLEPDLQLCKCSSMLHKSTTQHSMSLYHIKTNVMAT